MVEYENAKRRVYELVDIMEWELRDFDTEWDMRGRDSEERWIINATAVTKDAEAVKITVRWDEGMLQCESLMIGSHTGFSVPLT